MPANVTVESILNALKERPNQLARELAAKLGGDKADINALLYGALKGAVVQDRQYRWSLTADSKHSPKPAGPTRLDTPLAKLCQYFWECISFDDEGGASVFAASKFDLDYVELPENPLVSAGGLGGALTLQGAQNLLATIKHDKRRLTLNLGYPSFLRKARSRTGWEGFFVEPLFIFPLSASENQGGAAYILDPKSISLNLPLLHRLSGQGQGGGMDEAVTLMEELGLGESEIVEWDELFVRLRSIRPDWAWMEPIDPNKLGLTPPLAEIQEAGGYNRAILFARERSVYTVGLEKELSKLQAVPEAAYASSAVGSWISGNFPQPKGADEDLLEVLPLNSEQREAVRRGLSCPLTVITGPPGTGKSQVVTALLLNAAWKGKRVLFASKNNKAVDVVETRVNSLGPRPILLRLGTDQIRAALAEYLLGLLASVTTPEDKARYSENERLYRINQENITRLEQQAKGVIEARNKVDDLERRVEPLRQSMGPVMFQTCRTVSLTRFRQAVTDMRELVDEANSSKQGWLTRLVWRAVRNKRWTELASKSETHRGTLMEAGVELPRRRTPSDFDLMPWFSVVTQGEALVLQIGSVQEYYSALEALSNGPQSPQIDASILALTEKSLDVCNKLWSDWLTLQPAQLTPMDRRVLGDYASVLQLIVRANESGSQLGRDVFRRYYELFPKIAKLLPCWAITSLSANGRIPLEAGFFDLVVIDEASQCDIASALPLLFRAKSAVIIGDPKQLRHISSLPPERDRELLGKHELVDGFAGWSYSVTSLFDLASRLCHSGEIVVLRDHHRSHHDIIEFSNRTFYEGRLRIATRHDRLVGSSKHGKGIRWIPAEGHARQAPGGGSVNSEEAQAVVAELRRLVLEQTYPGTIGVVTPFRAQANLIRELASRDDRLSNALLNADFLAETAHRFQGDERDIMIFSPVVSQETPNGSIGFLKKTPNLFNVAITRARSTLIVVGSMGAAGSSGVPHFEAFARYSQQLSNRTAEEPVSVADLGAKYPTVRNPERVSDWERSFYDRMYAAGLRVIPQYDVESYTLDFALIDGARRLDIEVDGERYHRNWDGELLLRDRLRNQRLIELGWDVRRFWVYEIRDESEACIEKIRQWLESAN